MLPERSAAITQIRTLVNECHEMGWDGAGAEAISEQAAERAACLIQVLPENLPLPEVAPEPDGSISLDWIQSRGRLLSLSIGSGNRLPYAWVEGATSGHAVAGFDGRKAPPGVLEGIRRIMHPPPGPI